MAEVNKTSNIVVVPEIRKRGRAVTDIRFKISENPQLAILDLDVCPKHRRDQGVLARPATRCI
ncbi:MAG: hypothetical protein ACJAWM_002057 [Sulfitobacter sp.]